MKVIAHQIIPRRTQASCLKKKETTDYADKPKPETVEVIPEVKVIDRCSIEEGEGPQRV
jgi:hypothetical protein